MGENDFDGDSCATARGLHELLLEFNTILLLKIFVEFFSHTDVFYQSNKLDIVEYGEHVKQCQVSSENLIDEDRFSSILNEAITLSEGENVDIYMKR